MLARKLVQANSLLASLNMRKGLRRIRLDSLTPPNSSDVPLTSQMKFATNNPTSKGVDVTVSFALLSQTTYAS